jgi:hypothetical protein
MNILSKAAAVCGLAGTLALIAAPPAAAQIIIEPYGGPYAAVVPAPGPYYGYGYRYGYSRYWDYPAGYDSSGMPYSHSELGWKPDWPNSAPANPCWPGQRAQNRC